MRERRVDGCLAGCTIHTNQIPYNDSSCCRRRGRAAGKLFRAVNNKNGRFAPFSADAIERRAAKGSTLISTCWGFVVLQVRRPREKKTQVHQNSRVSESAGKFAPAVSVVNAKPGETRGRKGHLRRQQQATQGGFSPAIDRRILLHHALLLCRVGHADDISDRSGAAVSSSKSIVVCALKEMGSQGTAPRRQIDQAPRLACEPAVSLQRRQKCADSGPQTHRRSAVQRFPKEERAGVVATAATTGCRSCDSGRRRSSRAPGKRGKALQRIPFHRRAGVPFSTTARRETK